MAEHITSWDGISARDDQHRKAMEQGSERLLFAMVRELEGMRNGH